MIKKIGINFIASEYKIDLTLTSALVRKDSRPFKQYLHIADKKFKSLLEAKKIGAYTIHTRRLKTLWERIKSDYFEEKDNNTIINITIAEATPRFKGFSVKAVKNDKIAALLSIEAAPEHISRWKSQYIAIYLEKYLEKIGRPCKVDRAALDVAILKRKAGHSIKDFRVPKAKDFTAALDKDEYRPYTLESFSNSYAIILRVFDQNWLVEEDKLLELRKSITTAAKSTFPSEGSNINYRLLSSEIKKAIELARTSPAVFGVDLPIAIPAAHALKQQVKRIESTTKKTERAGSPHAKPAPQKRVPAPTNNNQSKPEVTKPEAEQPGPPPLPQIPENYPGKGVLKLKISDDQMEATITNFEQKIYDDPKYKDAFTEKWFSNELIRLKIPKADKEALKRVKDNLHKRVSLNGLVVAIGDPGTPAESPYILEVKKDKKDEDSSEQINVRNSIIRIVEKDERVGTICYKDDQKSSLNIYGIAGEPKEKPSPHGFAVGENVIEKNGSFYSKITGVLEISNSSVEVERTLIHNGSVNLSSGDISYDGPILIQGNVESNATVYGPDKITIEGMISSGNVISGGDLIVHGGILTGEECKVVCGGDLNCDFIDNGKVQCKGEVIVKNVIMNSTVTSGKNITVNSPEGAIAGSKVTCHKDIKTHHLGLSSSGKTEVHIGLDWSVQSRLNIQKSKFENYEKAFDKTQKEMKELQGRREAQLTKKHKELKIEIKKRLNRLKAIVSKQKKRIMNTEDKIEYCEEGKIYIGGTLFPNTEIYFGPKQFKSVSDLADVVLTYLPVRGKQVHQPEDLENREAAEQKKAS